MGKSRSIPKNPRKVIHLTSEGDPEFIEITLRELQISPRYELIKHLLLKNLVSKKSHLQRILGNRTIEDLVSLGSKGILSIPGMNNAKFHFLVKALSPFIGDTTVDKKDLFPSVDRGVAEHALFKALKDLKRLDPALLSSKALKEFWDNSFPVAPFEEELTFKQLAMLEYENLIKKRSVTPEKMMAISIAIERFRNSPKEDVRTKGKFPEDHIPSEIARKLEGRDEIKGALGQALLTFIEQELWALGNEESSLRTFLRSISETLSATEFLSSLMSPTCPLEVTCQSLGAPVDEVALALGRGKDAIRKLFSSCAPSIQKNYMGLLSGPGCTEEALISPWSSGTEHHIALRLILISVLNSLGATHPKIYDFEFTDLWTMNPRAAHIILTSVASASRGTHEELKSNVKFLLPNFDIDVLMRLLR